jgi:hypothetical protein
MDGFITESVAKISDGFLSAIKLILTYFLTKLLLIPIEHFLGLPGVIIYVLILLAFAAFDLQRSLMVGFSDQKRAWKGMAAGLLFWQAFAITAGVGSFPFFEQLGILFWVMLVLFTAILWRKILPIGGRMALLVFITCWMGVIYLTGFSYITGWPPFFTLAYGSIRFIATALGVAAVIFVVYRSSNAENRSLAAVIIFDAILFFFRAF